MKVTWIQDFNILLEGGGAQLTDRQHFYEGVRRGHEMQLWTPTSDFSIDQLTDDQTIIASNPTFCGTSFFEELQKRGIPYIYFFHDYWPCKWRLFMPMWDRCRSCYLMMRWTRHLERARMLIYLSPLHRDTWLWLSPGLKLVPHMCIPSPVNPNQFYPMGLKRNGVIAVQSLHPFKGREAVLEWAREHSETPVTIIGGNPYPGEPLPSNITYYDYVPQNKLNELYNTHQALLHLPVSPSPYDRTVAEAYLAGCDIIGNRLVGALSWPFYQSSTDRSKVAEYCKRSPELFWTTLEDQLNVSPF